MDRVGTAPETLPALASAEPAAALREARRWIATSGDPSVLARAHQAAGIVLRDGGDHPVALDHLRSAMAAARRSHRRGLVGDVRATYGATLALSGQRRSGLGHLTRALDEVERSGRAAVLLRMAYVHLQAAELDDALAVVRRALTALRGQDDVLWKARLLHVRCDIHLAAGQAARARADAEAAAVLFDSLGQTLMGVQTRHNRAYAAVLEGDLVTALREYDDVTALYDEVGFSEPLLVPDHLAALLAAGLVDDAAQLAEAALARVEVGHQHDVHHGPLLVAAATAALERGQLEVARARAEAAASVLRAAHRPAWAARAVLLAVRARLAAGEQDVAVLRAATRLAQDDALFPTDRLGARLLLARIAMARGDQDVARSALLEVASSTRGPALARATAWLARAMLADLDGDSVGVRRACGRGLDAVDQHRSVFGAVELSAAASVHGAEFAELAGRHLLSGARPRALLALVERFRSTALADPRPDAARDDELGRRLAQARLAAAAGRAGGDDAVVDAERKVRALRVATAGARPARASTGRVVVPPDLGERTLLELFVHAGAVHTLVVRNGRVGLRDHVARLEDVRTEVEFLRFALRRGASGVGGTSAARLERAAGRVEESMFGPAALAGVSDEVVVVPPAALHDVPWAALPGLADHTVVVSPSAAFWQRAKSGRSRVRDGELVALGPGLDAGASEVEALAALHPGAVVLGADGSPATVEAVLAAMDGARLAHLTTHGTVRADSPMFSALHLGDGPLFVHDLERLARSPREVILAACHSGLGADVGADQLLGLATGLLRAGTSAVLTSVVAVSDAATVPYVVEVHRWLADGIPLPAAAARALGAARRSDDPALLATAMSFGVWGA